MDGYQYLDEHDDLSPIVQLPDDPSRPDSGLTTPVRTGILGTTSIGTTGNFTNQDVNALLAGSAWNTTTITYSFPTQGSFYGYNGSQDSGEPSNNFLAATSAQQAVVRYALSLISQYTGLTFTEVTESASVHATLRVANSDAPATSWAYYPAGAYYGGDVWLGASAGTNPQKAGYDFDTIMHELGHAMGLKHGHVDDGTHGVLAANHDSTEWSIMTYKSYIGEPSPYYYTNYEGSGNQSYMADDIAALQYLYGANFTSHAGATTYTFSPTTGEMFIDGVGQGASSQNKIYQAIWDGNGVDTYNLSNYSTALTIDLRPGEWSTFSTAQLADLDTSHPGVHIAHGNIMNAFLYNGDTRSLIDNAIGGSGADTITGNQGANALTGGGGNDTLDGGAGADTAIYSGARAGFAVHTAKVGGVFVTTVQDTAGTEGTDTGQNIETYQFAGANFGFAGIQQNHEQNLDGARWDDVLYQSASTGVIIYADMNGTTVGGGFKSVYGGLPSSYKAVGTADLGGDARADAIVQDTSTGSIYYIDQSGGAAGTFHSAVTGVGPTWQFKGAGDFNGDGAMDVLIRDSATGVMAFRDVAHSAWGNVANLGTGWNAVGVGDFNRDGYADVAVQNQTDGQTIYVNMAGGSFSGWGYISGVLGNPGTAWKAIGAGDVTGDGYSDMVFQNVSSGQTIYANMAGGINNLWGTVATVPGWSARDVADVNNDGYADVIFQNNTDGQTIYANMQGGSFHGWGYISGALGTDWHVA